MCLIELLQSAADWHDDKATIYVARPWSCEADAVILAPAPETTELIQQCGKIYSCFLEAVIARESIEDYSSSDDTGSASKRDRCERLVAYAENDA